MRHARAEPASVLCGVSRLPAARVTAPHRPLTGLERVWLVADRLWPPFVIQVVIEGEGGFEVARWRAAAEAVSAAWPAARVRLHGALGWTRWVADGPGPRVEEQDGSAWDGRGPAWFTVRRIDPAAGPVVEVMLLHGPTPRVLVRVHHAVMDGRAAWSLVEDLGAALDGRPLRGGRVDGPLDADLARRCGVSPSPEPPAERGVPTGAATSDDETTTWVRRSLPTPVGPVLPRTLDALARAARRYTDTPLRVSLPVDLRRHADGPVPAANLTGFLRVDLGDGGPERIAAAIEHELGARAEAGPVLMADRLRSLPLALIESEGRRGAREVIRTGRCGVSGTVSNLGRLDPGVLSGGGFAGRRCFWVPPVGPGTPFFLLMNGHPEGLELCAGTPLGFASGGRLDGLLDRMVEELRAAPRG